NGARGVEGLCDQQRKALAADEHDLRGGLVMIGGPDTFGAGGWQGSKLEEVLPVNMDIPAQRQLPKGALVLVMHSCEMPDGNYWGEQCALKAIETLSERDEIGVISYAWNGPGGGGSNWDFPIQIKGDGSRVTAAIKRMQLGDMPSFDDTLDLALNGRNTNPQIEIPITAGTQNDPILAYWQTGLGKSVAFTGDAHNRWSAEWVGSPIFQKFWAQVVRGVSRPPMSTDFEVQTNQDGGV